MATKHGTADTDWKASVDWSRLVQYLTGYAAKAKDSLSFKLFEYRSDTQSFTEQWLTTYRLLTKRAPLVPEMWIYLANYPP